MQCKELRIILLSLSCRLVKQLFLPQVMNNNYIINSIIRLRFDLLRTCVIALRGFKKNAAPEKIEDLEFNLRPVAASY